jgi:hypothetical protein
MNTRLVPFAVLVLSLITAGCDSSTFRVQEDDAPPPPVENVQVENLAGGARITYDIPDNENLLYVKAEFTIGEGNEREVKQSYYDNAIVVRGFPDTSEYTGQLVSVSRGGNSSEPVDVTIQPLTPPVLAAANSIHMQGTFGGIQVEFTNDAEEELVFTVLAEDSVGSIEVADRLFTSRREGSFAVRGFSPDERRFGIFVRDEWENRSDTSFASLTPLREIELDKARFSAEPSLPNDTDEIHTGCAGPCGNGVAGLWDGVTNNNLNGLHTIPGQKDLPQWFTLDTGVQGGVRLSRFTLHHRPPDGDGNNGAYDRGAPKVFEVWGTMDPDPDGSFDNWTKLGTFESVRPSADESVRQVPITQEDIQFAVIDGEEFQFPNPTDAPKVRYLRFKTVETWAGGEYVYLNELTFFGTPEQ